MRVFRDVDGRVREERHPSVFMEVWRDAIETVEVRPGERRSAFATLTRRIWRIHHLRDERSAFECALWLPDGRALADAHLDEVNALLNQVSQTRERT